MKYFIVSYRWFGIDCSGWGSQGVKASLYINKKHFTEQMKGLYPKIATLTIIAITTLTKQEYDLYNS